MWYLRVDLNHRLFFRRESFYPIELRRYVFGALGEIRTRTGWLLRPLPLPIALPGHVIDTKTKPA